MKSIVATLAESQKLKQKCSKELNKPNRRRAEKKNVKPLNFLQMNERMSDVKYIGMRE